MYLDIAIFLTNLLDVKVIFKGELNALLNLGKLLFCMVC